MIDDAKLHRVFIGGLFHSVTEQDIRGRFNSFGDIKDVQIIQKNDSDGEIYKTFAYININSQEILLKKCFAMFGKTKWNGIEMKVQLAKDDFMKRLKKEWSEPEKVKKKKVKVEDPKSYDDIIEKAKKMKKSIPGTNIEGEKNWIVGKYGRPLPIVYLNKFKSKKHFKVDPSKHCHCLKKINDNNEDAVEISDLTWKLSGNVSKLEQMQNISSHKYTNVCYEDKEVVDEHSNIKKKKSREVKESNNSAKKKRKLSDNDKSDDLSLGEGMKKTKKQKSPKTHIVASTNDSGADSDEVVKNEEIGKSVNTVPFENDIPKTSKISSTSLKNGGNTFGSSILDQLMTLKDKSIMFSTPNTNGDFVKGSTHPSHTSENDSKLGQSILDQLLSIKSKQADVKCYKHQENVQSTSTENDSDGASDFTSDNDESNDKNPFNFTFDEVNQLEMSKESSSNEENDNNLSTKIPSPKHNEAHIGDHNQKGVVSNSKLNKQDNKLSVKEDSESDAENPFDFTLEELKSKQTNKTLDAKSFSLTHFSFIEKHENVSDSYSSSDEDDFISSNNISHESDNSEQLHKEKNIEKKNEVKINKKLIKLPNEIITTSKKIQSEKARQEAVKNHQKRKSIQSDLIKNSLVSIDKPSVCKSRIVFESSDSDSDNSNHENIDVHDGDSSDDGRDDNDFNESDEANDQNPINGNGELKVHHQENKKTNKLDLFDDDSEEENIANPFEIKKQFQGEKGEKLFKLQQKFGGDDRFRLDERFAHSSEDENESDRENEMGKIVDENNLQNERESQLSILQQVLGRTISKGKNDSGIKGSTYQRYDPTKVEHKEFELESTAEFASDNISSNDNKEEIMANDAPPVVSKEVYFAVDSTLKDLFSKPEEKNIGFSFLGESFQTNNNEHDHSNTNSESAREINNKDLNWSKALCEVDEKETDIQENNAESMQYDMNTKEKDHKKPFFTIIDNVDVFAAGKSFMRTESLETVEEQWKALRPSLVEVYKKKNKDALRRLKKMKRK